MRILLQCLVIGHNASGAGSFGLITGYNCVLQMSIGWLVLMRQYICHQSSRDNKCNSPTNNPLYGMFENNRSSIGLSDCIGLPEV